MARIATPDGTPSTERRLRFPAPAAPAPLMRMVSGVFDRLKPTVYVDWSDIPDSPASPYRARLTIPPEENSNGLDVREREVARGECKAVYEVRCTCGKRWFNPRFERIQLCPRCGCAVLLTPPATESA